MKSRAPLLLLFGVLAAFALGLVVLFRLRLGQGDVFPVYSTLRTDALGARALHDSLATLPGFRVERSLRPLRTLPATPPRLIVLAGFDAADWKRVTTDDFNALDAAVRAGSRLVIAARAEIFSAEVEVAKREQAEREKKRKADEPKGRKPKVTTVDLHARWGVELQQRELSGFNDAVARRASDAPSELPATVAWRSDVFFHAEPDSGWRTLYERGQRAVLLERPLGKGSIVLAGDSFFLSNEALQRDRPTALLAWLIGPHSRVWFDESHLGVRADDGIAALARRYGLGGACVMLLLAAALFVWRQIALFVPPPEEMPEVALAYHPAAGLEALLRRAVPADQLTEACATEWKRTARAADIARVDAALGTASKNASAATRYNLAVAALRRR